jgi:biopolymer transport protein ExbD
MKPPRRLRSPWPAAPKTSDDAITGINVTPLVDVTLVLLIIFMVTAKIIVSQSIPLDLPKAAKGVELQDDLQRRARGQRQHAGGLGSRRERRRHPRARHRTRTQKNNELRAVIKAD